MEKPKVILLVEDNPDDVELTLRALKKNNLLNEVTVARDGEEALDLLLEKELRPSLILLDLKLPKISGLEVLEQIRADEHTRRLPVVLLTSSREHRDIANAYDLGVNSYVQKPVDFNEFTEAVNQLGLYWLLINEEPPEDQPAE